uniref:Ribonuclease H1 N-terminal domain-containing protein n=1 Tax=Meloidogyne javanica TaxID=6303 RepID=A0A915LUK1_MELJA
MSENQPSFFYGVAYGYNRGVFSTYKEAMAAMKGFPQAVYKKFKNREDAEEFVQKSKPDATLFEAKETDTDDKFYAVARGRVIGIFKDLETVKKNVIDETAKSPRRKRAHAETTEGNTDGPTVRNVDKIENGGEVEEKKVEEEGDKSEVIMDEGKGQKDEENPSNAVEEQQKHAIMEE